MRKGYLLLIVALALVFLGVLVLPLSLLARLNAERQVLSASQLQALYLAEAGAREAIARLDLNFTSPSVGTVVHVCRSSNPCTPTSSDYVGCYTYSTSQPTDCTAPSLSGGNTVTFWSLGKTKEGAIRWIRVTYNAKDGIVQSWEVQP